MIKKKYGHRELLELNKFGIDRINYFKEKLLTEIRTNQYEDLLYRCEYNSFKSLTNGRHLVHRVYRDGRGYMNHLYIDARAIPLLKNDIKILDVHY